MVLFHYKQVEGRGCLSKGRHLANRRGTYLCGGAYLRIYSGWLPIRMTHLKLGVVLQSAFLAVFLISSYGIQACFCPYWENVLFLFSSHSQSMYHVLLRPLNDILPVQLSPLINKIYIVFVIIIIFIKDNTCMLCFCSIIHQFL